MFVVAVGPQRGRHRAGKRDVIETRELAARMALLQLRGAALRDLPPEDGATQARIIRVGVASSSRELHTTIRPAVPAGILGVGPVLIAPRGDRYVYGYRRVLSDLYVVDNLQ